jgi:hypothetical protein
MFFDSYQELWTRQHEYDMGLTVTRALSIEVIEDHGVKMRDTAKEQAFPHRTQTCSE